MDRLRHIEIFVAAAERLSFSGAARALGISPAAVSAAIGALEKSWRVRLFERTTRAVRLSAIGQALLDRGRRILRERSEEHTSELQSLMRLSYAVFCLNKK